MRTVTFVVDTPWDLWYPDLRKVVVRDMGDWALPVVNYALCDRCGLCVERCPTHAVVMTLQGPAINSPADCSFCTECEATCPRGAIVCRFEVVWDDGGNVSRREGDGG